MLQFFVLSSILSAAVAKTNCHGCFDGTCYSKSPVFKDNKISGQIAIDRIENIIYFHYENSQSIDYTAAFDLDDIRFKIVPGIDFSFARTVDQSNRDVYIGGVQGIFKYSPIENKTIEFGLRDETIWHLQYKGKIYYTAFRKKGLYTYGNHKSKSIKALSNYSIDNFVIDKHNDVYFMSDAKIYRYKLSEKIPSVVTNEAFVLSVDIFDNVYFLQSASRGLYKLNYKTDRLTEVGAFANGTPIKFVFDANNNVVYYDKEDDKLYYLLPNYSKCRVASVVERKLKKAPSIARAKTNKLRIHMVDS
ncbi:hypothetical protein O3G_MSEX003191 [Manduca sexta]|uniref:Ommochrome-binding protein n=1 Tax=Manduca sexta TaxID=7130 RepID=A0A921YR69_MANSE|nr:hypothetical protein O3G_MSEX003191 [Manduca sexta]